jgi:hypothetical protein
MPSCQGKLRLSTHPVPNQKGTYKMHGNSTRRLVVASGGDQVVGQVGLHALGAFADRLDLGNTLSSVITRRGGRLPQHDRGKVLVQAMLMLAGGGESCADIEYLRAQEDLFGAVPSDSTLFRTFHEITPQTRDALAGAFAEARHEVWRRSGATKGEGPVTLDIDASLVEIYTERKEGTGPHYKGGWGFHPILCFADATGEALSGLLRPGNAGANKIADHVELLDRAIAQLPKDVSVGHRPGDGAELVQRPLVVRTDSAGCSATFARECRSRHVGFFTVARAKTQIETALFHLFSNEDIWEPAQRQDGSPRRGAAVAELSDRVNLNEWPPGTRLIVRRDLVHPGGIQRSLFPNDEYRYSGHYTDQEGDPVELDKTMRAHAHVELNIKRLKESGLLAFPFSDLEANTTWMATVLMAADLVRWFQLLCLDAAWAKAQPKALRFGLFYAPGRLVRSGRAHIVRILEGWPGADALFRAYRRIHLLS